MAKAIITLTDREDGQIDVRVDFDPPVDKPAEADFTDAQLMALFFLNNLTEDLGDIEFNSEPSASA